MGERDPRVDAYIQKAKPFAQPILKHLREVVHAACPRTEETLKWSMPTFMYEDEMLCGFAAFKAFPPGARGEYIEWITEAKQEATRQRRLATTIEWLAEGKRRNWKYENC